jgi:plasmid stabilization system protein ParE
MSRAIRRTQDFITDFEKLFSWYADLADPEVSWRSQTALDVSLVKLSIRPDLGRPRHFSHAKLQGLRSFAVARPFENLLIFYRANSEALDVVRLMHGARNLSRRLQETPS